MGNFFIVLKVADFANFTKRQARSYRTNNIILTMGDDFHVIKIK